MLTLPILLHGMENDVQFVPEINVAIEATGGIILLKNQTSLNSKHIYIGHGSTVLRLLQTAQLEGRIIIICAGNANEMKELKIPENLNLVIVNLDTIDLANMVSENLYKYQIWYSEMNSVVTGSEGLDNLMEVAGRLLPHTLMLLNAGYKKLAAHVVDGFDDYQVKELQQNGYLSFESICTIQNEASKGKFIADDHIEYVSSQTGHYNIIRFIRYRENLVAQLCIVQSSDQPDRYITDLSDVLEQMIEKYMLSGRLLDYTANTEFGSLVSDLIECRLTDPEELEQRLKLMTLAVKKYYHVVLVGFTGQTQSIPWNYVISQLEQVFPFSNITMYKGDILIIVRKTLHENRLSFSQDKLLEILDYYDGYSCIGNFSKWLTSLRPIYIQTKSGLRLGSEMHTDKSERIFYYEDYSIYHLIELSVEASRQGTGSNLVYLCCPALIALQRYDKKYNNNLKEVLYIYLTNERNSSKTARDLHIHRNTMLYKMNQIEEIIGQSLDDPILRERLLFSYHVVEYIEKYRHEDPLVLKRNTMNNGKQA